MRFLVKVKMPVESGNRAIQNGTLAQSIHEVMADVKPEAAYFLEEDGERTAMFIVNITEPSQIPAVAEPFYLRTNARVYLHPVMTPEDLGRAGLDDLGKKWGV